ncbi:MAG: T9SS C-terminal target domain-containing protein, partial [Flavobacteriia bacterium]
IPGGGSANDEVLIDDVELIYNLVGLEGQKENQGLLISIDEHNLVLIEGSSPQEEVEIYQLSGQLLLQTTVSQINGTALSSGFYIIRCAGTVAKIYVP